MSTELIALIVVAIWAAVVFIRLVVFPGRKKNQPASQNNWQNENFSDYEKDRNPSSNATSGAPFELPTGGSD